MNLDQFPQTGIDFNEFNSEIFQLTFKSGEGDKTEQNKTEP